MDIPHLLKEERTLKIDSLFFVKDTCSRYTLKAQWLKEIINGNKNFQPMLYLNPKRCYNGAVIVPCQCVVYSTSYVVKERQG